MKMGRITGILISIIVAILILPGVPEAQIVNSDDIILNPDGTATVPLYITTSIENISGIQGTLLYDPSRMSEVTLAKSPNQPGTCILRSHSSKPGEVKYVLYSRDHFLRKQNPVILCQVKMNSAEQYEGFESVLIHELSYVGKQDAQIEAVNTQFTNIPIKGAPKSAAQSAWGLYE